MSEKTEHQHRQRPEMEINLDRPKRVRNTIAYWLILLAVAFLLAVLMARFTGSVLIAVALSGGMLLYMLLVAAAASKSMGQKPGGRLD